jgi:hypothetical protein
MLDGHILQTVMNFTPSSAKQYLKNVCSTKHFWSVCVTRAKNEQWYLG